MSDRAFSRVPAAMLAAVISEPERAAEKQASFLRVGYEIADGKNLWPTPP